MNLVYWCHSNQCHIKIFKILSRFLSQPFFVAAQFTGLEGKFVKLEDTIRGFKDLVDGKLDDITDERAFYLVGTIEEVRAKAELLAQEEKKKAA